MSSFGGIISIFTRAFLESTVRGNHQPALLELADYFSSFNPPSTSVPLRDWFDFFYSLLLERYRCEYVYKNVLATRLYLDRHSLENSVMTNEFRSGSSRADMVIINDTSTVYEVKSGFDNLARLEGQISDYQKIFDHIFVVTTVANVPVVLKKVDSFVGIMVLREDGELDEFRESQSNKCNTDPGTIFDSMRQAEYCSAVQQAFGSVPRVPNSQLYRESRELFCQLEPNQAHDLMVKNVRSRRIPRKAFIDLINEAPDSLKHTALVFSKSQALASQVRERLKEPI